MPENTRRKYTKEFKSEVVEYAKHSTQSKAEIAKEFDIPSTCLYRWLEQAKIDAGEGRTDQFTTNEKDELRRLRKENRRLKEEKEILKKAAVFFARDVR